MMSLYCQLVSQLTNPALVQTARWVIGLSGGMDSRVLLDLMSQFRDQFGGECLAVHVHHGLSRHADAWAQRCELWCQSYRIPLVVERVVLGNLAGESVEARARQARYQALAQHMQPGDVLLTGQHRDDQMETVLLALRRGSGPKGLSAMASLMPFAGGQLLRPLLDVGRADIDAYAKAHQLDWVDDESNQDSRYERNYLRHHVIPLLKQRWPAVDDAFARSARLCAEQERLLDELLEQPFAAALLSDGGLSISQLASCSEAMRQRLIRMWLWQQEVLLPSAAQMAQLWHHVALAKPDANPQLNLNQGQIRRYADGLYWLASHTDVSQWRERLVIDQTVTLPDGLGELALQRSLHGDIALPPVADIEVIFEPQGLSAHPTTRGHSRKLKKLFQEYGVPSWLRRRTPIVLCNGEVVAVAGLFVSRAFAGQDFQLQWHKKRVFVPES